MIGNQASSTVKSKNTDVCDLPIINLNGQLYICYYVVDKSCSTSFVTSCFLENTDDFVISGERKAQAPEFFSLCEHFLTLCAHILLSLMSS